MTADRHHVDQLLDDLVRGTGLRLQDGQHDRVARALAGYRGQGDASRARAHERQIRDALVDAIAIDESYFFRHPDQLDFLRETVLPALLAERGDDHVLQLWSAGCADGEEPYTLAMILVEEGLVDRAAVLGTDLTDAAVGRARRAVYSRWALRSPETASRSTWFEPVGRGRFRLHPEVTKHVSFRPHNLLDVNYPSAAPGPGFDVILCRNVLLHLTSDAIEHVVTRLVAALAPGGWLITAPADPPPSDIVGAEELEAVTLPTGGVVYRRATTRTAAAVRSPQPVSEPTPARPGPPRRGVRPERPRPDRLLASPPRSSSDTAAERCRRAHALLLSGDVDEAVAEAMAAAFLDADSAGAHLVLGLAAAAADRRSVAARGFRRAADLLAQLSPEATVDLFDGEPAAALAGLARAHALLLDGEAAR